MEATADTLLNQVADLFLSKIDKQNIDPKFLKKFTEQLLGKFSYTSSEPIKQRPVPIQDNSSSSSNLLVEDLKKVYKGLIKTDATYKNDYKAFLKYVLPEALLKQNVDNVAKPAERSEIKPAERPEIKTVEKPEIKTADKAQKPEIKTADKAQKPEIKTADKAQKPEIKSGPQMNEGRADLIKDTKEPLIVLFDGLTDRGYNNLKEKLPVILKDIIPKSEKEKEKDSKSLFEHIAETAKTLGTVGSLLSRVAGPVAAVVGGEIIGGQIGKAVGSNETISKLLYGSPTAGKEAYEKYGTGVTGLSKALYASYEQSVESKKQKEDHQQMSQARIKKSSESLAGKAQYDPIREAKLVKEVDELREREKEFKEQYEELKSQAMEGWNPFADENKENESRMNWENSQEMLITTQNRLAEFRKLKKQDVATSKRPPVALAEGGIVTEPTKAIVGEAGPEAVLPLDKYFDPQNLSLNNTTLEQIAGNTKDTNKALNGLTDAIIRMVGAFNQKASVQGSTTVINAGGGSKDPTSASMAANLNLDPIRRVRSQFAV